MDNKEIALELTKVIKDELHTAIANKAQVGPISASDCVLETYFKILDALDTKDQSRK